MAAEDNVEKKSDGKGGLKSFIAGGCGGVCVVLSGHPFDTIKVSENSFKKETFLFFEKGKHSQVVSPFCVLTLLFAVICLMAAKKRKI